jgi:hypothetical protein
VVGVGDFTGNGTDDILFRNNTTGDTGFYQISNGTFVSWHDIGGSSTAYSVVNSDPGGGNAALVSSVSSGTNFQADPVSLSRSILHR